MFEVPCTSLHGISWSSAASLKPGFFRSLSGWSQWWQFRAVDATHRPAAG